jgi:hypothetical protein
MISVDFFRKQLFGFIWCPSSLRLVFKATPKGVSLLVSSKSFRVDKFPSFGVVYSSLEVYQRSYNGLAPFVCVEKMPGRECCLVRVKGATVVGGSYPYYRASLKAGGSVVFPKLLPPPPLELAGNCAGKDCVVRGYSLEEVQNFYVYLSISEGSLEFWQGVDYKGRFSLSGEKCSKPVREDISFTYYPKVEGFKVDIEEFLEFLSPYLEKAGCCVCSSQRLFSYLTSLRRVLNGA